MSAIQGVARQEAEIIRFTGRDIAGLVLCAEHYAAPYDLLAEALAVRPDRLHGIVARWRAAGCARAAAAEHGPAWCWLTPAGMAACGLAYPARPPELARLAHIRAVLAARLWLESGNAYADGQAWWRGERAIRAALPADAGTVHVPAAEIHWPSSGGSRYAGRVWAVEAVPTPMPAARAASIMAGLLAPPMYARVVYLTAPSARPVIARVAGSLPGAQRERVAIRDLPAAAFFP